MIRRRDALKGLTSIALGTMLPVGAGALSGITMTGCSRKDEVPPPSDPVFGHGIASGDPTPNAVILWTRISLANAPSAVDGRWEMAKDATFGAIVAQGTFSTNADRDYTVKVDATGLEPGTTYYYRFIAAGRTSLVGRTRTAPLDAKRLRFAVVSCASLPHGYFHLYRAIAERPDIDAVVHLGDYIYEYAEGDYGKIRESEPKRAVQSLGDYRERYAQYRRDPDLQEIHRQHPFICIWDDHEIIDNAYKDGTTGDNPVIGSSWPDRKAAAIQAYSEWIPIRDQEPKGRIWRALSYGSLADLVFLDTRLWGREQQVPEDDPRRIDPARQMLGADQEAWLRDRLRSGTAKWKLVCQQMMMVEVPQGFRVDGWDDYPAARNRFFDILEGAGTSPGAPLSNVVVLSGDVHSSWASDLARTPADPATYDPATGRGSLAVELITPAISSPGTEGQTGDQFTSKASWIKFAELEKRGFILLDVTEERVHGAWFHIDSDVIEREARGPITFAAGFATYSGTNHLVNEPKEPELLAAPPLAPADRGSSQRDGGREEPIAPTSRG